MSNTRETISLKYDAEYYKGKRKGKDTCDDAFPLSFLSLRSWKTNAKKKKKRRKKAGDPRQRLRSWIFFFLFFPL